MTPPNHSAVFDRLPPRTHPHPPIRPLWLCRACAAPWPCPTARLLLQSEFASAPAALSILMVAVLHEAMTDLHALNPGAEPDLAELFGRFVGWTSRGPLSSSR
ncbi:hypothetical protein [Plantactinospora sp. WMMB782]|uniref:hypothetical protein n=1 Tax=Plantactinospora sp. WMMB782 TaxID=3404121 RepID=UPI003B9287FC